MPDDTSELNPYLLPVIGSANTYQAQASSDAGIFNNTKDFIWALPGVAAADIYNSTGAIQKFFGGDGWETDTHDLIAAYDNDAADYYTAHKGLVDGAELLATSIVPGTLAIKGLRMAQAGLANNRIATAIGFNYASPSTLAVARKLAADRAAFATNTWNKMTGELGNALAIGVVSNTLDMAAFSVGALAVTNKSPLYDGMTAIDLAKNAVVDSLLFGGVLGGAFSTAKTLWGMRDAALVKDLGTLQARKIDTGSDFDSPAVRLVKTVQDYGRATTVVTDEAVKAETSAAVRTAITSFAQRLTPEGDDSLRVGIGNFAIRFQNKPLETAQFFGKLTKFSRLVQDVDDVTKLPKLSGQTLPVDITTGSIYGSIKDAPYHLADTVPARTIFTRGAINEIKVNTGTGIRDRIIKVTDNVMNPEDIHASYLHAALIRALPEEVEISSANLPMAERMIEEAQMLTASGKKAGVLFLDANGNAIGDLPDAINALRTAKIDAAKKLLAEGVTIEDAASRINVSTKFLDDPFKSEVSLRSVSGLLPSKEAIGAFITSPRIVAATYDIGSIITKRGIEKKLAFQRIYGQKVEDAFTATLQGKLYKERLVTTPMPGATTALYEEQARLYIDNVLQIGSDARALASTKILPQLANADLLPSEAAIKPLLDKASRIVSTQSLITSANNDFGTWGAVFQKIGSFVNRASGTARAEAEVAISSAVRKLTTNQNLGAEWQLLQSKLGSTAGDYVLHPTDMAAPAFTGAGVAPFRRLLRQDLAINQERITAAEATGKTPVLIAEMEGDAEIFVTEDLFNEVLRPHVALNNIRLKNRVFMDNQYMPGSSANKAVEVGLSPMYRIPVNTLKFPHFLFVKDASRLIGNGGSVGMITAKDAEQLLAKKVALEKEFPGRFEFISKGNTKDYFKAKGEYDYSRGMNESFVDSTLRRTGRLADMKPTINEKTNQLAAEELLSFHQRMAVREVRDAVEMRFSDAFGQLEFLGKQFDDATLSAFKPEKVAAIEATDVRNPYRDAINMALDIGSANEFPLWRQLNAFTERAGDSAFGAVTNAWEVLRTSPLKGLALDAEVAKLNEMAKRVGLEPLYSNIAGAQFAEQLPTRPVLRKFIAKAQAMLNGVMLGADPMQAVNTMIGQVMFAAEFRSLLTKIATADGGAGALVGLTKVKIPNLPYSIDSAIKLHAGASKAFLFGDTVWDTTAKTWKQVTRNELVKEYTEHNVLTSISKQYHQMLDDLTLTAGNLTDAQLNMKIEAALEKVRTLTGNNVAEEYSRFVVAHAARRLTDAAMSVGVITDKAIAATYWNTAVNRAHGVNIASQRAVVFQGVIGQSIGMFMTYQHNLMQQLFRYAASGDAPAMKALAASQLGLYGAQGLPAFNAVSTHLIGNAYGNPNHTDPYTYIARHGGEAAEWVLYGGASNLLQFVHPDLKVNLYSRGDINPRQLTVFPTSLEQTVAYNASIGAISNMFDVLGNIYNGAPVSKAILHGIEHNNLNRPLAGVGAVLRGMQTDKAGKWIGNVAVDEEGSWDMLSLSNYMRIAGAKPLNDAAAADAMYRTTAYKAATSANLRELSESMRLAQEGNNRFDSEKYAEFMQEYAKRGGNIKNFRGFVAKTFKTANSNQVTAMAMKMRDPQAQHIAAILGATDESAWVTDSEW